ncbi:MAG: PaaI family thioesterase [Anaerolineae bacterium]
MIEDINAQMHTLIDSLTYEEGLVALSALKTMQDFGRMAKYPFNSVCGVKVEKAADGESFSSMIVAPHHLNVHGILHGGAAYTLADVATGSAAFSSLDEGQNCVTQDLHYRYLSSVKTGKVTAVSKVLRRGRRSVVVEAKIYSGDKLIGTADGTYAVIGK